MSKAEISEVREDAGDVLDGMSLDEAIEQIQKWKAYYNGTFHRLSQEYAYDGGYYLKLKVNRSETDEEYRQRLKNEETWKKNVEAQERAQFERLKAKFEDIKS